MMAVEHSSAPDPGGMEPTDPIDPTDVDALKCIVDQHGSSLLAYSDIGEHFLVIIRSTVGRKPLRNLVEKIHVRRVQGELSRGESPTRVSLKPLPRSRLPRHSQRLVAD